MPELVQFPLPGGGSILVETGESGAVRTGGGKGIRAATASIKETLQDVVAFAGLAIERLEAAARTPEEVEIEFGVRLTAEAGAVIARTEAEGHLQVKVVWRKPEG